MNETDLNDKVIQILNEFEKADEVQFSSEWNRLLLSKIATKKQVSAKEKTPMVTFVLIIIVAMNFSFFLIFRNTYSGSAYQRDLELKAISKELFINPISLNR